VMTCKSSQPEPFLQKTSTPNPTQLDTDQQSEQLQKDPETTILPESHDYDLYTDLLSEYGIPIPTESQSHPILIDVIPDTRFFIYIIICELIPILKISHFEQSYFVSPSSILGYTLVLLYGFLLYNDSFIRPFRSKYSEEFLSTNQHRRLLDIIINCKIPYFILPFLSTLISYKDPFLKDLRFCSSLTCYNFEHDYGRLLPASIFFTLHNVFTENSQHLYNNLKHKWLTTPIFNYYSKILKVSNFLNSLHSTETRFSNNWLNSKIYEIYDLTFYHTNDWTSNLSHINIRSVQPYDQLISNPYIFLMSIPSYDIESYTNMIQTLSQYVSTSLNSSTTILQLIQTRTGSLITSYLYIPPCLPTWNTFEIQDYIPKHEHEYSSTTDSNISNFMIQPDFLLTGKEYPRDTTIPIQYSLSTNEILTTDSSTTITQTLRRKQHFVQYSTFKPRKHTTPNCLLFNNLNLPIPSQTHTPFSGIIITHGSLEGFATQLPNPHNSNIENSSLFRNMNLPMSWTIPAFTDNPILIPKRTGITQQSCKISLAITDMTETKLPRFYYDMIDSTEILTLRRHEFKFIDLQDSIFKVSRIYEPSSPIPTKQTKTFYAWSSYRILEHNSLSFIVSLQHIFGLEARIYSIPFPPSLIRK